MAVEIFLTAIYFFRKDGIMANNKENPHLSDSDIYRLIKQHDLISKHVTIEDIKSVFLAYYDVVNVSVQNGIDVNIPKIGVIKKVKKKGWKGRRLLVKKDVFNPDDDEYVWKDIPTKPDFFDIKLEWKKKFQKDLKEKMNI